jgi:hypothetical protein
VYEIIKWLLIIISFSLFILCSYFIVKSNCTAYKKVAFLFFPLSMLFIVSLVIYTGDIAFFSFLGIDGILLLLFSCINGSGVKSKRRVATAREARQPIEKACKRK